MVFYFYYIYKFWYYVDSGCSFNVDSSLIMHVVCFKQIVKQLLFTNLIWNWNFIFGFYKNRMWSGESHNMNKAAVTFFDAYSIHSSYYKTLTILSSYEPMGSSYKQTRPESRSFRGWIRFDRCFRTLQKCRIIFLIRNWLKKW
jgi:hypothetical protein